MIPSLICWIFGVLLFIKYGYDMGLLRKKDKG